MRCAVLQVKKADKTQNLEKVDFVTGEKWDMGRTGTLLYLEKYSANQ